MLKLTVMVKALVSLLLVVLGVSANPQVTPEPPIITNPVPGAAVQGLFPIEGNISTPGFKSAELSFAYHGKQETWFLIDQLVETSESNILTNWDTTKITDGTYDLRIVIYYQDKNPVIHIVEGIRIRNYSIIETNTPTPTNTIDFAQLTSQVTATPVPSPTSTITPTPILTPTPLPTNALTFTDKDISNGVKTGAMVAALGFLLMGVYISLLKIIQRG